jgi:hypothetical protein
MNQEKIEEKIKPLIAGLKERFSKLLKKSIVESFKDGIEFGNMAELLKQFGKANQAMSRFAESRESGDLDSENSIIIDRGDGYKLKAAYKRIGAFEFIAVDWEHPNVGFFTDALFFWRSLHLSDWKIVKVARWAEKYNTIKEFFEDYPRLAKFFEQEVAQWLFASRQTPLDSKHLTGQRFK